MKLLVNTAVEQMGLSTTQVIGTLLDGSARHTPEGAVFSERATQDLMGTIAARDEAFGDYAFGKRTAADSLDDWEPPAAATDWLAESEREDAGSESGRPRRPAAVRARGRAACACAPGRRRSR